MRMNLLPGVGPAQDIYDKKYLRERFIASEAEQSEASSQSKDSLRESERAPVPVYGKTKQLDISKTKHI